ncbi:hypothetical protein [Oceanobacillus profundus]|uniref:Uncharacterized protein n=1 Tax=Oceanobacillus profundus TaxID=372463 RepID=A0A417YGB0_9BACI|nr:hypothetical protein [Oceanobacillus profundus]MBR2246284.1 hypothetical protein [Bacilli bacterium]MBR3119693.1 hypothetical protein [Oceanobacillus sp.]RHW31853.1 hypothetical protein D1B32_11485 [Oceanobacillus profundus]
MELNIQTSEIIRSILKEQFKKGELERAVEAGNKIHDAIGNIVEEMELTVAEVLYATLAVNEGILEECMKDAENEREKHAKSLK